MKTIRMTTEHTCLMLEGIPLRLMLTAANQRIQESIQREAEARTYADDDLTGGERLFGKAVNS